MNALAKLLNQLLGWNYDVSLWICSAVVLVYVLKGGLTSAIYTEVLQFFMIVLGFAPGRLPRPQGCGRLGCAEGQAARRGRKSGRAGMIDKAGKTYPADSWTSAWKPLLAGPGVQSDGRGLVRHGLRPGFRPLVRLLVYQFPRRPARHGRQEHERRPPHAA